MLEYKAVLTDFAQYKGLQYELNEYVIRESPDSSSYGSEQTFECEISADLGARPLQISLSGQTPEPMFRTFGPTGDLEISLSLGYVTSKENVASDIEQVKETYSEFFAPQDSHRIEVVQWDSENGYSCVGLLLRADNLSLSQGHLEVLDYYLMRAQQAAAKLILGAFSSIEAWTNPVKGSYHTYVHEAASKADRIFLVGGLKYLESQLVALNWQESGASFDDPNSIPEGFIRSEFVDAALWDGEEVLETETFRGRIFDLVASKLSAQGDLYMDDEQMLWVLNHEIITASAVYMSINSGITLGSRGYFKIPEGSEPFKD